MATLLTGMPAGNALVDALIPCIEQLKNQNVFPTLAILRIGERPDDLSYEKGAMNRCAKCGIAVKQIILPVRVTEEELAKTVLALNLDETIHGVLMLRPFPEHINSDRIISLLDPKKDVDGMTAPSLAKVYSGVGPGFPPCTAEACMEILRYYEIPLAGRRAVVVGRSLVIGKPVAMMLLEQNATVTLCHSRTANLEAECQQAEILVVALGRAKFISTPCFNAEQIVLDVGINEDSDGSFCGDVDFQAAEPIVKAITPVPRGIGGMTTALLAKHLVEAAEGSLQAE